MNDIDQLIREALAKDEADVLEQVSSEKNPLARAMELFQGRYSWFNGLVAAFTFAIFVGQVWCAVKFFGVESIEEKLAWAVGFLFAGICVGMLKLWSWMELNKNSVIREVKRLELQVAYLNKRLERD